MLQKHRDLLSLQLYFTLTQDGECTVYPLYRERLHPEVIASDGFFEIGKVKPAA